MYLLSSSLGSKNIEIGVDDDGLICLSYEADEIIDENPCLWSKNYTEPIDDGRAKAPCKESRFAEY